MAKRLPANFTPVRSERPVLHKGLDSITLASKPMTEETFWKALRAVAYVHKQEVKVQGEETQEAIDASGEVLRALGLVDDAQVKPVGPLDVACPICKAAILIRCVSKQGRLLSRSHIARMRLAEQARVQRVAAEALIDSILKEA